MTGAWVTARASRGFRGISSVAALPAVFHDPLTPSPFQNRDSVGAGSRASPEAAAPAGRPGEDWGEAEPLTLNRSGRRSSGGVRGFRPKAVPCTPATWRTRGVGQRPTVFRLGPVLAVEAGRRAGRTGRDHRHGSRTHPAGQAACLEAIPRARLWRGWQRRPESCAGCPVSVWPWTLLPACEPRSVASWPSPV